MRALILLLLLLTFPAAFASVAAPPPLPGEITATIYYFVNEMPADYGQPQFSTPAASCQAALSYLFPSGGTVVYNTAEGTGPDQPGACDFTGKASNGTTTSQSDVPVERGASCPSGYSRSGLWCDPPPPSCQVDDPSNPTPMQAGQIGTEFYAPAGADACVQQCKFAQGPEMGKNPAGVMLYKYEETGDTCGLPPTPPPNAPCTPPDSVGTINGVAVCIPAVPDPPAPPPTGPSLPAPNPSGPVPNASQPWSYFTPVPPASSASSSGGSTSGGSTSGGSTSGGSTSGGSTSGGSTSGGSTSGGSTSGGSTSGGSTSGGSTSGGSTSGGSTSGGSTSGGSTSGGSTSGGSTSGGSTSGGSTTPSTPASSASSSVTPSIPAGLGSSPYTPAAAAAVGIPVSNPFTLPSTPSLDLPGNSGTCAPLPWHVGTMSLELNICPYLDAVRPVLDWAVMAAAVIASIVAILARF